MAVNSQTITTLHSLLDYNARKLGSGEIRLRNILPVWVSQANSLKLKETLQKYLDLVTRHAQGIEEFMEAEGMTLFDAGNRVIKAFIEDAGEKMANCTDVQVKDACLLASVQDINHFKISEYGTAAAFAKTLDMEKQAAFFHEAEVSEKQIDDRLTQLAEFEINTRAIAPLTITE